MRNLDSFLGSVVGKISDQNYEQSFAFYRLWFEVGQKYSQIPSDMIFDTIWKNILTSSIEPKQGKLIHPTAHLIIRLAKDAEGDRILAPHTRGLQNRLCARILQEFFGNDLEAVWWKVNDWEGEVGKRFYPATNFIAHWANLGYIEEVAIRNHVLQSLISHQRLYDHQVDALYILFKIAGSTLTAYANPSAVDRCFELLKGYCSSNSARRGLVQEIVDLRERGWEGLPPPPLFTTEKPRPTGVNQKDPGATPVATPLGLPNGDTTPSKLVKISETVMIPGSPITRSPSTSISTPSDFAIADPSDDKPPIDPTALYPHETFYLQDGNVEVSCGNTLFRVHTSVLSFHSPVLHRMVAQISLATAESPNGCPRILSSDTATDFSTLLKVIYLPGFPERVKVPDFVTFSSLLRVTAEYELSVVRSQLLELVRDAYPETFEGLDPSKTFGERVFSGPTPHPNAVLNLFVQQELTSALPMAYYMAVRRGLDPLMDRRLPRSATLSPEILQAAIRGLMSLREVELNETHRLIFGPRDPRPCLMSDCASRTPTSPTALEAYREVFDRIVGPSRSGTRVLQVPKFYMSSGADLVCVNPDICFDCVEGWESGHEDLRKKAWAMLPDVFGLKG